MDYQVVVQDIGSGLGVDKAGTKLASRVKELISHGWTPHGGLATFEAAGSLYLLQAMVRTTDAEPSAAADGGAR
jgi:hypothetical protein